MIMSAFLLRILSLLSFYGVVHSACSESCVHFEGADSVSLPRTEVFCKKTPYDGSTYYEPATYSKTFLYYDTQDHSWNIASRVGAKTVFALAYDSAEDPTDISSTWKIGPSVGHYGFGYSKYNRAWEREAQDDSDMEVKCGKYHDKKVKGDFTWFVVGIILGSIIVICLIGICLYKVRQRRRLLALRRELLATSVREYMFVSILAARLTENRHPAIGQAGPTPPPAYEDCTRTNPDLPPPYQESTIESPPNYTLSNCASVANPTSSPDPTNSCTGTVRRASADPGPRPTTDPGPLPFHENPTGPGTSNSNPSSSAGAANNNNLSSITGVANIADLPRLSDAVWKDTVVHTPVAIEAWLQAMRRSVDEDTHQWNPLMRYGGERCTSIPRPSTSGLDFQFATSSGDEQCTSSHRAATLGQNFQSTLADNNSSAVCSGMPRQPLDPPQGMQAPLGSQQGNLQTEEQTDEDRVLAVGGSEGAGLGSFESDEELLIV